MQNKYPKPCAKCGVTVQPYTGICERVNGAWIVEHITCDAGGDGFDTTKALDQFKKNVDAKYSMPDPDHPAFRIDEGDEPLFAWMDRDMEESLF